MPIQIYCRIKEPIDIHGNNISMKYHHKQHNFSFHQLWNGNETHQNIFSKLNNQTYNKQYFVFYGYTGSGKSYTCNGLLHEIFKQYNNSNITISALQIYHKQIYDLLSNQKLTHYKTDHLIIKNLSEIKTNNIDILKTISENRHVTSNKYNIVSSRSHAIIYITIKKKQYIFIDMAGQENKITYSNMVLNRDAKEINLDILALKNCILQLKGNKQHISFRQCLLTLLLKNMFNNDYNVSFICTLSKQHTLPTQLDTLKYITGIQHVQPRIQLNEASITHESLYDIYNNYINEVEWCACQEREICRKMNRKNYTITKSTLGNISKYLERKITEINKFKKKFKFYEQIYHE